MNRCKNNCILDNRRSSEDWQGSLEFEEGKCTIRLIKDIRTLRECDVQSLTDIFSPWYHSIQIIADWRLCKVKSVSVGHTRAHRHIIYLELKTKDFIRNRRDEVKLPPMERYSAVDEPDRDELQWRPGYINEESEHVISNNQRTFLSYKRATRSFRMFAMVRNEQITQMERDFKTGDLCMHDAIITLHKCDYNVNYAIEAMNKNDEHMLKVTNFMSVDDAKNLLDELVQFYYGWKKTRDATRPKPLARQRNTTTATHRKPKSNQLKASRPGSTDLADYASASETEMEELENDGRAAAYACHHCYTSSNLRPVDRPSTVPPSLYKPRSPEGNDDEEQGVRTRANKKERRGASLEMDKRINGSTKKRFVKGEKEDENTDVQEDDEPGVSSEVHSSNNLLHTGKMNEIETSPDSQLVSISSKIINVDKEGKYYRGQSNMSVCAEKGSPSIELQTSTSVSNNAVANKQLLVSGAAENEVAEAVEIATEQPSTSFVKNDKNALLIRVIDRRCGQMCARTDLAFRMKPGSEWDKKREARAALKNHINSTQKKSNETFSTPVAMPKLPSAQLAPLSGTPNVEAFMGVSGLPGMFPGMPDPRFGFLTPQQQYAIAVEQQVFQKQMEQQLRAHQLEMIRNGANGTVTTGSTAAVRDSPAHGGTAAAAVSAHGFPSNMLPSPFHNFGMDPRALAALMHNPQLASQFGISIDSHTAAMMSALEQRNNLEQRMFTMAGMEMLAPGGIPVSQAPQSHFHPHAAAMMQHAAAAHPGDALQLQQLLAMSAAAQAQAQRPFLEQNALLQMTMMNPFSNELGSRIVNPGALNSDMMRRLQQEGGFATTQRPTFHVLHSVAYLGGLHLMQSCYVHIHLWGKRFHTLSCVPLLLVAQ
ncbi:hypothetical protein DINM_005073 [Dirofilaria immitis]|nr:hypothetical protein [Dirofilaria immitis]